MRLIISLMPVPVAATTGVAAEWPDARRVRHFVAAMMAATPPPAAGAAAKLPGTVGPSARWTPNQR